MTYHTAAYAMTSAIATLQDVPAVTDGIFTIQNNHLLLPRDLHLLWAIQYGATMTRAEFTSPHLRQTNPSFLRQINLANIAVNNPNINYFVDRPLIVKGQEELQWLETDTAAENIANVVSFFDILDPIPQGEPFSVHATSSSTAVIQKWTSATYTLDTGLPQGRYAMISSQVQSTNAIAHRWTFDDQFFRPGFPSLVSLGHRLPFELTRYMGGVMGYFRTFSLPRLEVFCNVADASHDIIMEVIRVGN